MGAAVLGALALVVLPVRASAHEHRRPDPLVTGFVVHFFVTAEKKPEDGVTLTAMDRDGTVVAQNVVQPGQGDWLPQQDVQIPVNPSLAVPISHLEGGKIHIDSGKPAAWAANIEVFATLSDGTTRQVTSETMQPIAFNWTGQNGTPFYEGMFINADRP